MTFADAIARLHDAERRLAAAGPRPFPVPVTGLEAVIAGSLAALGRGDWWVPGLRERVGAVLRDVPIERLVDGLAGARPYKVAPPTPSPALRALHAVGIACANPQVTTLVHLGVGSAADGAFHEALNLAALRRANVVFVVAVHPLGEGAPVGPQLATTPAKLAVAFGIPAVTVDGTDAQAVYDAVHLAKDTGGPALVEARLAPKT